MTTKRNPYVREMTGTWWTKLDQYRFYILRESTAIGAIWFSFVLLYGVFCLKDGGEGLNSFVHFLRNPMIVIINIISLLAALLQTKTWFELAPKAANIIVKGKQLAASVLINSLWIITAIASLVLLFIIFI